MKIGDVVYIASRAYGLGFGIREGKVIAMGPLRTKTKSNGSVEFWDGDQRAALFATRRDALLSLRDRIVSKIVDDKKALEELSETLAGIERELSTQS
jgi:hypothetical protein